MELFKDIYKFLSYLNFVDVIFFASVVVLLVLIITLLYFIKLNKEVLNSEEILKEIPEVKNNEEIEEVKVLEEKKEVVDVLPDLLGLGSDQAVYDDDDEEAPLMDLESLTKKLKSESENHEASVSKYEQDQEEKAIISYEELLKRNNKYAINYEKEDVIDDLIVKKVNLNDLTNKDVIETRNEDVKVFSYEKEEAFLSALKELNRLLN